MTLKFVPGNHRYYLDRKPVPGVTTLIKDGLPSPALMYWSAKSVAEYVADNLDTVADMARTGGRDPLVQFLKGVPWQKAKDAALRGTEIHALAEKLAHGETVDVPDSQRDAVEGYARFLDDWQVRTIWTERPIANRAVWYAGTPDLIANMAGETWLLDVKTGKGIYGNFALQLAAYAHADFYVPGDDPDEEAAMPNIDRLAVLHVADDGTTVHEVTNPDAAWLDFRHVAWTGKAKDRIANYFTGALPAPEREDDVA